MLVVLLVMLLVMMLLVVLFVMVASAMVLFLLLVKSRLFGWLWTGDRLFLLLWLLWLLRLLWLLCLLSLGRSGFRSSLWLRLLLLLFGRFLFLWGILGLLLLLLVF